MTIAREVLKMTNRLALIRQKAGLSRTQLAESVGISKRTIEAYEQGKRKIDGIGLLTAIKISKVLNCSPVDLLDQEVLNEHK
jgi:transcriptional regulator with XRE-family HTH domain